MLREDGSSTTSGDDMRLSIVICTHNRATMLASLLERLGRQLSDQPAEIIVVDSASAPRDAALVAEAVARLDGARLLRLDEKGVSLARNTGLAAAAAPWIAFIDDDERPCDGWIDGMLALAQRLPDDCGACGGVVRPAWDGLEPSAFGPRWRAFLGEIIAEGEFDQTDAPQFGIGHSIVRVAAVKQAGGFDLTLGRQGKVLLSGEEVLLLEKLTALGWRIWHSSAVSVDHVLEPERLKRRWARQRAYWEGVTTARMRRILSPGQLAAEAVRVGMKTIPLALSAAVYPLRREIDIRLAFNAGLIAEFARPRSPAL